MATEKFFWADAIADRIIKEKSGNKNKQYICASGITPSGTIHIGNFREVITTDLVVRALKDKGKKVRFIYSWDDYDRFRKVPSNIPNKKDYEDCIGMALSEISSPYSKNKSYAEFFEEQFEKSLEKVGIKPEFIRQSLMNKKCKYADLIKTAIEKKQDIKQVLDKYRKEPLKEDWVPLTVYCEKCKKDFTKVVYAEGYFLEYQCECGFKDKIDFRKKGIVKLKWRVDWPARWFYEKVDFEPGGIDHSVFGGSFMTSKEIVKKVFDFNAPLYQLYEWVKIKGGKEFSSSTGNVLTLDDVEEIYEPEVLRYLFVKTRPKAGFQISFDNDVIKIYEDYDELERKYYSEEANSQEKRVYELSRLNLTKKMPERIGFRHLITLIQANKTEELGESAKKRAEKVFNWLEKYASDEFKFKVQEKLNVKLKSIEKRALLELREKLKQKDFAEKELFDEFYNICSEMKIKNTDFFDACYRVFINKKKGPRLASLILAIGKEKIIKLLEQIK